MKSIIKRDVLSVLAKAFRAIRKDELLRLREISNEVIHNASIFQDEYSISTAILIYAISKVSIPPADLRKMVLPVLKEMVADMAADRHEQYRQKTRELLADLEKKSNRTVSEMLQQAQISKGTKIYDHGISLPRVAETLGISVWDLTEYIGKTGIAETMGDPGDIQERLSFTRRMFN